MDCKMKSKVKKVFSFRINLKQKLQDHFENIINAIFKCTSKIESLLGKLGHYAFLMNTYLRGNYRPVI